MLSSEGCLSSHFSRCLQVKGCVRVRVIFGAATTTLAIIVDEQEARGRKRKQLSGRSAKQGEATGVGNFWGGDHVTGKQREAEGSRGIERVATGRNEKQQEETGSKVGR